ncbi:hypothetical protein B0H13DRAFT_2319983 [Mycena leptocephala]|nr:hypothetical protein B0H13DRAFT_2319983 [Mycena leptocephala]
MKPLGPAFSHLTHLELFTDLRLGDESEDESFWRWHMNACEHLLAFAKMDLLTDDPRFVMMELNHYIEDWQRSILVGRDHWRRADAFIARRLSGEIERASSVEYFL